MNKILSTLYNAVTDINRATSALYAVPEAQREQQRSLPTALRQF